MTGGCEEVEGGDEHPALARVLVLEAVELQELDDAGGRGLCALAGRLPSDLQKASRVIE